jgi:hypothetical protein
MVHNHVVCGCPISIYKSVLSTNLVVLFMICYDVILGIDWLLKLLAIIDFARKQVTLRL